MTQQATELIAKQMAAGASIGKIWGTLIFNVKDAAYGAVGNGTTDDTAAIKAAINAAKLVGGQVVFPPGTYRVTNKITIDGLVSITGAGWTSTMDGTGTIIFVDFNTAVADSCFYVTYPDVSISNIEFKFTQPTPAVNWVPNTTPWCIYAYRAPYAAVGGNGVRIINVMLRNPTHGIKLFGLQRAYLNGIYGQPLVSGISIDGMYDVCRVDNVHFWASFWSGDANVISYMRTNLTAIESGKNDNPIFNKIFIYVAFKAIRFFNSTAANPGGVTERAHFNDIGLDSVTYGITVDSGTVHAYFANLYIYCFSPASSRAVWCKTLVGDKPFLTISNGDIISSDLEAVRLDNDGQILLSNVLIRTYGLAGGAAALYAGSGGIIDTKNLSIDPTTGVANLVFTGPGSIKGYQKQGTLTVSGNGTATGYSIPHGLTNTPTFVSVQEITLDAGTAGIKYITFDGVNINVFMRAAPIAGTNNVAFTWKVES